MPNDRPLCLAGGTVIDGGGGPPRRCDVVIEAGRVAALCESPPAGSETADARGCIIAPGFIDVHGHSDLVLLALPAADSRVHDGVTTEICGCCGYSAFPLDAALRARREQGLNDLAGTGDALRLSWSSGAEFFEAEQKRGAAINRVYQVGHGNVRALVMGDRPDPAPPEAVEAMARLLERDLPGTAGLSTGLAYPPGSHAGREELVALAAVLARTGRLYSSHIRDEGDRLEDAVEEAIELGRVAGAANISHLKTMWPRNWGKIKYLRERLRAVRAEGLDLTADRYPYTAAATDLDYVLPNWLSSGGVDAELARLGTDETRRKLSAYGAALVGQTPDFWDRVVISRTRSGAPLAGRGGEAIRPEGRSIRSLARALGRDEIDVVIELLRRERTRVDCVYHAMSEDNLREILSWPFVMVGSDSGARAVAGPLRKGLPHPRTFGTFSRFLSRYTELGGRPGALSLPEAIRRITALPARRYGLLGRGRVAEGMAADLTVFDPSALADRATFEDPFQYSAGIRHVLVQGEFVLKDGEQTGALPGRVLLPNRCYPLASDESPV